MQPIRTPFRAFALLFGAALLTGCTTGGQSVATYGAPSADLKVCSGYGCIISQRFALDAADDAALAAMMANVDSPASERAAIRTAIGWFERTARAKLRYRPDVKKAYQANAGKRGQMDCVDESLNTTAYLQLMQRRGLLKHHTVRSHYAERGLLVDGRYPHKSAVILERGGRAWTVDSWYEDDGIEPQIMPLSEWRTRGIGGAG